MPLLFRASRRFLHFRQCNKVSTTRGYGFVQCADDRHLRPAAADKSAPAQFFYFSERIFLIFPTFSGMIKSTHNVRAPQHNIRSGIKVVITELTRNPPRLRLFRPPVSLCFQGFSRVLKTKYFVVLTRRSNILVFPLF